MLRMPRFSLEAPETLDDAVRLMAEDGARLVAGGTDLLPNLKHHLEQPARPASALEHWVWRWPGGRTLSFDANGRLRRIASQGGPDLRLGYDGADRLVEVASSAAHRLRLRYRAKGAARLETVLDDGGVLVHYGYDANDRLATASYADGGVLRYQYAGENGARLPHDA